MRGVVRRRPHWLAWIDISTAEFIVTECAWANSRDAVADQSQR